LLRNLIALIILISASSCSSSELSPSKAEEAIHKLILQQLDQASGVGGVRPSVCDGLRVLECNQVGSGQHECVAVIGFRMGDSGEVTETLAKFIIVKLKSSWVAKGEPKGGF
jgi:hypothetical protein